MEKPMGYLQVIDNLVYHAIQILQDYNDNWDALNHIAAVCAETYNIPFDVLKEDYEKALEIKLLYLAR